MVTKIYAVYDQLAKAHLPFFPSQNDDLAKRMFRQSINSIESNFNKAPADYTLFFIGEWDDNTAELVDFNNVNLGNGVLFLDPSTVDEFTRTLIEANQ